MEDSSAVTPTGPPTGSASRAFWKIFTNVWNDDSKMGVSLKIKIVAMALFLIVVNITVLTLACVASLKYPLYLSNALLAYSFGLRHAVDADHIAAIDNVVRKLVQEGKQPVTVGFFFSLGHSTVVFLLSCGVAFAAPAIQDHMDKMKQIGSIIGVSVSAGFLFLIGIINLLVLINVIKTWRQVINGDTTYNQNEIEDILAQRGFMNRYCGAVMRRISKSWHMYPLGFLFGLGFDTASEVAVLAMSGALANTLPISMIILLPLLFAAGMSLLDTADGIGMIWCYGWAFINPIRKLYYNMVITLVSVLIAFVIGLIEVLGIFQSSFNLEGGFWDTMANVNSTLLGEIIIGIFLASILISMLVYRYMGYEDRMATDVEEASSNSDERLLDGASTTSKQPEKTQSSDVDEVKSAESNLQIQQSPEESKE
eukprot:TRINITY_DN11348_c0_g1_i1.p1 TRINITY_DN11348_c0_g1~~TRINITY_DN11348_c0_g1_i1.p1  ORF type:complete len:425 (+),score=60.03 TRINITY_DN11348_c0_g1_i1:270-1544(+)